MQWLARRRRPLTNSRPQRPVNAIANLDPVAAARLLKSDGVVTGLSLREDVRSQLCDALSAQPCYGAADLRYPFLYRNKLDAERRYGQRFLHKGQEPTARNRLVFQLRYALRDYGTGSDAVHREWLEADRAPV